MLTWIIVHLNPEGKWEYVDLHPGPRDNSSCSQQAAQCCFQSRRGQTALTNPDLHQWVTENKRGQTALPRPSTKPTP